MAITVHPNVKFCSKRFLSLFVCKHRREAALSLQIDAAWRKLRSSLLALLLSINLLACASWLNDFVQKWQNLTSFPPYKLWERRECLTLKKKKKVRGETFCLVLCCTLTYFGKRPLFKQHRHDTTNMTQPYPQGKMSSSLSFETQMIFGKQNYSKWLFPTMDHVKTKCVWRICTLFM